MSQFKKSLDSEILKEKFNTLLKSLDRTNTSKMIIERCYGEICSLEIAEGKTSAKDVQDELRGIGVEQNKVRHLITASTINEKSTTVAIEDYRGIHSLDKLEKKHDWEILKYDAGDFLKHIWMTVRLTLEPFQLLSILMKTTKGEKLSSQILMYSISRNLGMY
jgi:hypothetical protein